MVAVDSTGAELYRSGEPDKPTFYRSAVKPLQATVALEAGLDLDPEHIAVASASHGGWPAHTSIVRSILTDAGLLERTQRGKWAWFKVVPERVSILRDALGVG